MNKQKGFTLIELIVVIAIIAILAAIVLVNVTTYITKAKDAAVRADLSSAATGMAACYSSKTDGTGYASCYSATADTTFVPLSLTTDIRKQNGTTTDPVVTLDTDTGTPNYCAYAKLPSYTATATYACTDSSGVTTDITSTTACTTAGAPACN